MKTTDGQELQVRWKWLLLYIGMCMCYRKDLEQ